MDNKINIISVTIKNFRSIRRESIKINDFNIFVGMNDAGKSNVLKALNLFFNGEVESGTSFSFQHDFTYLYPPKSKEAKAITVSIQFSIPNSFSDGGLYRWEKVWKQDGLVLDEITDKDGKKPGSRSRIPTALRRIKYRYVPAVKSSDYYKTLLCDLYTSVTASLQTTFSDSVQSFSEALSGYTQKITIDVAQRLNLKSALEVPEDLNDIFKALIFRTNRTACGTSVPLTYRGDGIQARHIPIILRFIASEDQKSRNQGSTKITTIWGFEEPENGLELSNAFDLANEFFEYSSEIQIFITTHSPAFYMKKCENGVSIFFVEKREIGSEETKVIVGKSSTKIADEMGLMPLVAPFIAEQLHQLEKAKEIYNTNILTDVPTIMVEGETDVAYLGMAIQALSPTLDSLISDNKLRIIYKNDGAGTTQLCDWVFAWLYSGFKSPLYVLLDKDGAGIDARNYIVNSEVYKLKHQTLPVKIANIQPSESILNLFSAKIKMLYEIEHLLSYDVWCAWKTRNYVVPRSDEEMRAMFDGLIPRDKSFDSVVDDLVTDISIRDTILSLEPQKLKKKKMVGVVYDKFAKKEKTFDGFKRTVTDIDNYFSKLIK